MLYNGGGYLTLSFIPTLGTMLLGVVAGRWFQEAAPKIPLRKFLIAAAALCAAGLLLHFTGICPIVKRIWTPAWTLLSGGVCFLFLAAFSWIIDVRKHRGIAFPLVVVGMNSIAAYVMADCAEEFVESSFRIHLGMGVLNSFGPGLEPHVSWRADFEGLIGWYFIGCSGRRSLCGSRACQEIGKKHASGAKAHEYLGQLAARLKSCHFKTEAWLKFYLS